jgi:hypothetical protein
MTASSAPVLPSREEIALLDVFQGLEMRDIELVATAVAPQLP